MVVRKIYCNPLDIYSSSSSSDIMSRKQIQSFLDTQVIINSKERYIREYKDVTRMKDAVVIHFRRWKDLPFLIF